MFNKTVADADITISMSLTGFIMLIAEMWRVAEDWSRCSLHRYSKSKGQPLLNGVQLPTGFCEGGCHDELDQVLLIASIIGCCSTCCPVLTPDRVPGSRWAMSCSCSPASMPC